ncbi:MAG TPA: HD domain-containing phosphohydrolase [bacterium]|nr:HD domain-containing phosphohydrolase [bacterium]HPI75682.1 HD domain-containing phosphohydrolase [bacterium]HPN93677.1 HD domain-containing phosphohydrolase [bacterium]
MTGNQGKELWQTLTAVSTVIGCHDLFDESYPVRMAGYARALGAASGMEKEEVEQLEYAALLHDIGQIKTRETILKKPGRLTRQEYLEVQAHPIESEKIIEMMPNLGWAAQWARWRHEWWDGSGYPDRIAGEAIPLPSRILAVVDSFGAMLSERPYRQALEKTEALAELKLMAGIQFDPAVVETFIRIMSAETEC